MGYLSGMVAGSMDTEGFQTPEAVPDASQVQSMSSNTGVDTSTGSNSVNMSNTASPSTMDTVSKIGKGFQQGQAAASKPLIQASPLPQIQAPQVMNLGQNPMQSRLTPMPMVQAVSDINAKTNIQHANPAIERLLNKFYSEIESKRATK